MTWEGKYDWTSHKEIAEKLDKNSKEELSSMLGKNWIDVPIEDISLIKSCCNIVLKLLLQLLII